MSPEPIPSLTAPQKPSQSDTKASTPKEKVGSHRFRRLAWISVILLVLTAVTVWIVVARAPKPPVYLTEAARMGNVEKTVLATGVLAPYLQIDVGSRASGAIVALRVEVGDEVKKGDAIADIDSATQTNNLNIAQAALTDVEAQRLGDQAALNLAQANFDRAATLSGLEVGPRTNVEATLKALKSAQAVMTSVTAQIDQAKISVATSRVNLGYTHIVAPIDGTVLQVTARQGQTVNAAQSAPTIVTLGQVDRMTIKTQIAEADVINVRPGMPLYFTILGAPDHRYLGRLRAIEPAPTTYVSAANAALASANASSTAAVYYNGIFDVENPDRRLKSTMTANVSIILSQVDNVLTVSASALGAPTTADVYTVRVVGGDKKATPRRVRIGLNDGARAQVLSGLTAGELIVVGEGATGKPAAAATTSTPGNRGPRSMGGL